MTRADEAKVVAAEVDHLKAALEAEYHLGIPNDDNWAANWRRSEERIEDLRIKIDKLNWRYIDLTASLNCPFCGIDTIDRSCDCAKLIHTAESPGGELSH